jgi:predicted ATPase/class 3 adenylate cyclase/DNA-binding XRE family transcriptional regulator
MTSDPSAPFGELLRRYRQAAGLTQEELAERAGLSRRGIADLESGARKTPRKDTVALLAAALGLSEEERTAFVGGARRGAGQVTLAASAASPPSPHPGESTTPVVALPTGTVTFLFTDLEGSTRLLQQLGTKRYAYVLASVRRLLRAACAQRHGFEVDVTGDGSFFVFAQAPEAVAAAVQAQRAISGHQWPAGARVVMRVGLHTGTAQVAGDHYIGLDVHRAARIAAAGHGGQTLLSWATCALAEADLPDGVTLRELGAHRLKDLQRPEHLSQLVVPDLPGDFPPLNSLDAHPHNLPIQLTSFVGREREVAELQPLLQASHLLTLTGPGGTGKTRLALCLAAEELEAFAAGVWLVELAPLADPALVPQTVAAALGVRELPGRPILDALRDFVRGKALLLILDNCEHLIDACAQVAETLLRAAPDLRILATSREAFGIAGETTYRVPSLPLPDSARLGRPRAMDALARNDCVRLFAERAAVTLPAFHLTATNTPAIAEIGRRLDGIPLAIELAAARTKVLPPEQIAAGLDDRFRLLTGGSRTALPRHQTLLALIEWSYELLTEPERVLLRRLSVFAGGWSLEAAQAVCGEELGADVLGTLAHLVDKSLIDVEDAADATEGRFRLLETIRQYARGKLVEAGEAERVSDRHLAYCIHFAEEAEPHLRRAEQLAWLDHIEREHDNLRAALAWALASGQRERALRLAGALSYFWLVRGYLSEGQKWVDAALAGAEHVNGEKAAHTDALPGAAAQAHRAKALHGAAWFQFVTFDPKAARALVAEELRVWRELGDRWWIAVSLELEALIMSYQAESQPALACLEEAVALARQIEDPWVLAICLIRFGRALKPQGKATAGRPYLEEGVALARGVGDRMLLSEGLRELGSIHYAAGDLEVAASLSAEALALGRAIGSRPHIFLALSQSVVVACLQENPAKAKEFCAEILVFRDVEGSHFWASFVVSSFGLVACVGGEPSKGVPMLAVAFRLIEQAGGMDQLSSESDPMGKLFRQALEKAKTQLGPAAFQAAWAHGQRLNVEQALALATSDADADAPRPALNE